MQKFSRRYKEIKNKLKNIKYSNLEEALIFLKQLTTTKFIETFECHINLNTNSKDLNQQIRATTILPYGNGKILRIAALVTKEDFINTKLAGIDIIGNDDLIEKIKNKKINFDLLLTTPSIMPKLAKLGKILGPKGLMPSLKSGTITNNLKVTLNEFRQGKIEYKTDKNGIIHISFGKSNFKINQLIDNLTVLYKSIEQNKPSKIKGKFFKTIYICSTMSPSIKLDLNFFK